MLFNLEAEQARRSMKDSDVAAVIGVKRETYTRKKKNMNFKFHEIKKLLKFFDCSFEYLFASDKDAA